MKLLNFFIVFVFMSLIFSTQSHALLEGKPGSCVIRSDSDVISNQDLLSYYSDLDLIFKGEVLRSSTGMLGIYETTFKPLKFYKGHRDQDEITIMHSAGKYAGDRRVFLVRSKIGDDGNLYADPVSCVDYFTDDEVLGVGSVWYKGILGALMIFVAFFIALKVFMGELKKEKVHKA